MYEYGHGVQKNKNVSLKWYKLAAEKGNNKARNKIQSESVVMYEKGYELYMQGNYTFALPYFGFAAKEGNVLAQYYLGILNYYGKYY